MVKFIIGEAAGLERLVDVLLVESRRTTLECAVAALRAARSHRLGLPAVMSPREADALWRDSAALLRNMDCWPFACPGNRPAVGCAS